MSPNSNQLTFTEQIPIYYKTLMDLLNSVTASLTAWVASPFLLIPFVTVTSCSVVIFWSLIGMFACQV